VSTKTLLLTERCYKLVTLEKRPEAMPEFVFALEPFTSCSSILYSVNDGSPLEFYMLPLVILTTEEAVTDKAATSESVHPLNKEKP